MQATLKSNMRDTWCVFFFCCPRHRTKRGNASHAQIKCAGHMVRVFIVHATTHTQRLREPKLEQLRGAIERGRTTGKEEHAI